MRSQYGGKPDRKSRRLTAMDISTIGFTKKPARRFFDLLMQSDARRVVDVRLNNASQLGSLRGPIHRADA